MAALVPWCLLALCAGASAELLSALVMADIGHPREHRDQLTSPWPMGKCAYEGAFSLYEGLRDYVENQGARPTAAVVVGDVAYGGGDAGVLNDTRDAFQKYLRGQVAADRIFPVIGNHDIHYLGCSVLEFISEGRPCYYGAAHDFMKSTYQMSFAQWRANWLAAFPGLRSHVILPPSVNRTHSSEAWLAPLRYNLNLQNESSVYIIAGLISGAQKHTWNNDTPSVAIDAASTPGGAELECRFLRDSLAHGRSLGKTIFVYLTHYFTRACDDWSLIQQMDVWIVGHKHSFWQSEAPGATLAQEQRHYPVRVLIGNGGFDEGLIDVVSFGHLREEQYESEGGPRIKLHFDVFDTCVGAETCPSGSLGRAHCWERCKAFPGGFDGGGGARRAMPSSRGGFVLDAPKRGSDRPSTPSVPALFGRPWRLLLGTGAAARWLALGKCGSDAAPLWAECLVPAGAGAEDAATFVLFGNRSHPPPLSGPFRARLAVEDARQGPVMGLGGAEPLFYRDKGFWDVGFQGTGLHPADSWEFWFSPLPGGRWEVRMLAWRNDGTSGRDFLGFNESAALEISFHDPSMASILPTQQVAVEAGLITV